jgi:predicted Zn-dependent peptidase
METHNVQKVNYIFNNNNLFFITVYVPCGSIYEHYGSNKKKKITGVSHFLEHLLFKHTENFTGADILKEFTRIGGYYNASTDKDQTMYYVKTLSENYKMATDLLYDIVVKPVFLKDDINDERKVVLEELAQSLDDFTDALYDESTSTLIPKSNVYYPSVIGKKTHLKAMNVDDIVAYYKRYYGKYMVVVNCDKRNAQQFKDVSSYIEGKFGLGSIGVDFDELKMLKVSQVFQHPQKMIRVELNETFQYNTAILFPSFRYREADKHLLLNFVKFCLTDAGLYSILSYEVREKRGLVYSIRMSNERMRYLGIIRVTFATSNKDIVSILEVIMSVLYDLRKNGLSKSKLAYFKESYRNHMMYKFTNEEYRASWYGDNLFYGSTQNEKELFDGIKKIRNEDVKTICREVFNFKRMGVYTNGNYDDERMLLQNLQEKIDYWSSLRRL